MTDAEFRELVNELAAEELDKQTAEGLMPVNMSQEQVQFFYQWHLEVIYHSIILNPHLKEKLPNTPRHEVEAFIRRMLAESDRRTREQMGMPYRNE